MKYGTGKEHIQRIDILIPNLLKIYNDFGDYFQSENDSTLSAKTIQILERLSAFPHKEKEIVSLIGISPHEKDLIFDVGKSASLLDTYISPTDSESIIFSPLYWDDNPKAIFNLLEKHKSVDFF